MTKDCLFEKKWVPILPAKIRPKPEDVDYDEIAAAKFDRGNVDRNLFDLFYDQSETLKEMEPAELNEFNAFWKQEELLAEKAKEVIK